MNGPTKEQLIIGWALDCGLIDRRDLDNGLVDALFDDLRRFAELAYVAGQTAEREACAQVCDVFVKVYTAYDEDVAVSAVKGCAATIRTRGKNENIS